jgi:hypothetical protein
MRIHVFLLSLEADHRCLLAPNVTGYEFVVSITTGMCKLCRGSVSGGTYNIRRGSNTASLPITVLARCCASSSDPMAVRTRINSAILNLSFPRDTFLKILEIGAGLCGVRENQRTLCLLWRPHHASTPLLPLHNHHLVARLQTRLRIEVELAKEGLTDELLRGSL